MAEELFGWMFVANYPILFEKRRMAKQVKVEAWLDLAQVLQELGVRKLGKNETKTTQNHMSYIV
jgi:hypothetical protein